MALQTNLTEEQYNYLSSIKDSSELLLRILDDMLAVSEVQNSRLKFHYEFFNLHELLHNLIYVVQYSAQEKGLKLELSLNESIPKIVNGDKLRLYQILYNLTNNAIKFTEHGTVKIKIQNLYESHSFVQLKFIIEDTGIGIPAHQIDAVFETFTRIRQKGKLTEGTGLGLPIAKNLIEQQGGKISANSTVGKGSTFFFDLIFELGEEIFPRPLQNQIPTAKNQEAIKILLVEDHKMNQIVAKKTLEKHWKNIEISIANDGLEAISLLTERHFDLILMDIQMPNMDGYEATHYIRHKMPPAKAEIPIIAMTAHASIAKNEKFRAFGMDDCIIKPFEPRELFRKITEFTYKVISD